MSANHLNVPETTKAIVWAGPVSSAPSPVHYSNSHQYICTMDPSITAVLIVLLLILTQLHIRACGGYCLEQRAAYYCRCRESNHGKGIPHAIHLVLRKMAEVPAGTPLVAKDLDISCISCGDEVDVLSCLPCLHSVSVCEKKECRQNLLDRKASCSHCKETFSFPSEGFPHYTFAERKFVAKQLEEEGIFCYAEHESPQLAVIFCSSCPGPLCEECHSLHRTAPIFKKHKFLAFQEAVKGGIVTDQGNLLCCTHNESLKCFCQDCEVLICTVFPVVGPHQSHRVLFVDKEVGEMNKQLLVQCIKAVKRRMDKMSSVVRDIDDRLFTLHEEGNHCKEDIVEMKNRMIEAVTNRCAVLISEVEEAEENRTRDLEEYKETLQNQMKQLEHFKTSAEDIVHDSTTREQLSVRKAMIQRASTLISTPIPPPPPSSSSIHFVSEKREEAEKILSQVGGLSLGADPKTSTMEGLTIANNTVECCPWNVSLMLKVVTRDHSGSQCAFGGENVVSVLTPTTCGVPVLGKVEDNGDGTYQVIFVSVPSEECKLFVTVNGVHIKGSPVNVKVCYPNTIKQEIRDDKERQFRALVYTKQGTLLATDNENEEVCAFAKCGEMLNSFKVQDSGDYLDGIASFSDGKIAVSLYRRGCIAVYRPNGELVKEFRSDRLDGPEGLAVSNKGQLFVAELGGHRVSVYSENGEFQFSFGSKGSQPGEFKYSEQICIGQDGLVYVSDHGNNRIQVFHQNGHFVRQFGKGVVNVPIGLALTRDGHIVVVSKSADKLSIFSPSGECVHEVKDVGLEGPYGVAVTDDGFISVADSDNCRIVKL